MYLLIFVFYEKKKKNWNIFILFKYLNSKKKLKKTTNKK